MYGCRTRTCQTMPITMPRADRRISTTPVPSKSPQVSMLSAPRGSAREIRAVKWKVCGRKPLVWNRTVRPARSAPPGSISSARRKTADHHDASDSGSRTTASSSRKLASTAQFDTRRNSSTLAAIADFSRDRLRAEHGRGYRVGE